MRDKIDRDFHFWISVVLMKLIFLSAIFLYAVLF
jgi:hypothetical protein